jgi:hypothetical protein
MKVIGLVKQIHPHHPFPGVVPKAQPGSQIAFLFLTEWGSGPFCPFFYSTLLISTASGFHTFRSFSTLMYSIIDADASFSAFSPLVRLFPILIRTKKQLWHLARLPLPLSHRGEGKGSCGEYPKRAFWYIRLLKSERPVKLLIIGWVPLE